MTQGWIKTHRQILENPLSRKPDYFAVWMFLLLRANHKDAEVILGNEKITIKTGSFVGSVQKICDHFSLGKSSVYRILKYLETERMLERSVNAKYTVFIMLNWGEYQEVERTLERSVNAQRTLADTNKNDNNAKNEKESTRPDPILGTEKPKPIPQASEEDREVARCFQALGAEIKPDFLAWLAELKSDLPDRDFAANAKAWRDHFEKKHPKVHKSSFRQWVSKDYATKKSEDSAPSTSTDEQRDADLKAHRKRQNDIINSRKK